MLAEIKQSSQQEPILGCRPVLDEPGKQRSHFSEDTNVQWEFQDPKMEVLFQIRLYVGGISPYIGHIYGRYLQFRFLKKTFTIPTEQVGSVE